MLRNENREAGRRQIAAAAEIGDGSLLISGVNMSKERSPIREPLLHLPGQSLDETIQRLWDDRGLAYFTYGFGFTAFAIFEWIRWFSPAKSQPWLVTAVSAAVLTYCTAGILRVRRQALRLKLGRDGERAVAEALDGLRASGCIVYHDIVGNGFNVDHVVVSPWGIFVVETKTIRKPPGRGREVTVSLHDGRINAGGADLGSEPLEQAKAGASWLFRLLKESTGKRYLVKPCVVFPGWFVEPTDKSNGGDIWVLNPKGLASFIANGRVRLREEDVHLAALHLAMYIRSPWAADNGGFAMKISKNQRRRPVPAKVV